MPRPRKEEQQAVSLDALEGRILMAADPISPDHALWAIPTGEAVVDGVLDDSSWQQAEHIFRTQASRSDRAVNVRYMYSSRGLYVGIEVEDNNLWADGNGGGSGAPWELESDDSLTLYFDQDGSRDEFLQASDRALGFNIAPLGSAISGSGPVARSKFIKGDGRGGAPGVYSDSRIPGEIHWAINLDGTLNDNSDVDGGWTAELFMPWSVLGMSSPHHGQTMGMNFDLIYDNDGGTRNLTDNRHGPDRFNLPMFVDDYLPGAHSSYTSTLSGLHGPINYAEVMFIDPHAVSQPAQVMDLAATDPSHRGAILRFTAPAGTLQGQGHVSSYQIRYATSPIETESDWQAAAQISNNFVPRLAGLEEMLRVPELGPRTMYFFTVRGVDAAGNLGAISNAASVTTLSTIGLFEAGRVIPSPNGGGFMKENGESFVPVGDHLGISWGYTRNLFSGDVWDAARRRYHNFAMNPSFEGAAGPYFSMLKNHGINTMRLFLELPGTDQTGNPQRPRGEYWLERPAGEFNHDMKIFMHNVLRTAAMNDMHVIFSPFDTFAYDETFWTDTPWATTNGGPLSDINDFFQTPRIMEMAKQRMDVLIEWVNDSPFADRLLAWEPVNEWDSWEWTLNAQGDSEPGRETEMRNRAIWINELASYIREQDPNHMIFNSTAVRDPRGPLNRAIFNSRNFDALAPHLYTNAIEEPINNPDEVKWVRPAVEHANLVSYWMSHRIDNRPVLNGEWGLTRAVWPGGRPAYTDQFTQAEDEQIFRSVIWSGFASGLAGTALRIPTDELDWNYYVLTDTMRDLQLTFSEFADSASLSIDFANFNHTNLAGNIKAKSNEGELLAWGIADGSQGIAYILQDMNQTSSQVLDGRLSVDGLIPNQLFDVEFWSTAPGMSQPFATQQAVFSSNGKLTIDLPSFAQDVAVKFKARSQTASQETTKSIDVGSDTVTFALDERGRPLAHVRNTQSDRITTQDLSAISGFTGRVRDLAATTGPDGRTLLALTDAMNHVWLISGDPSSGQWAARDLTNEISGPGLSGDLTTFQSSWGSIHIAGLDARGHLINYWTAPGLNEWRFDDLTERMGGPKLAGNLVGYETSWDGLNVAGLDESGDLIVYWWAPDQGEGNWQWQNLTDDFNGSTLTGRIDAYVTPWGAINITGTTRFAEVYTYWWSPDFITKANDWKVANISAAAYVPRVKPGVQAAVSDDGHVSLFVSDLSSRPYAIQWSPDSPVWRATNLADLPDAPISVTPLAASSAGDSIILTGRTADDESTLITFSFFIEDGVWQTSQTDGLTG